PSSATGIKIAITSPRIAARTIVSFTDKMCGRADRITGQAYKFACGRDNPVSPRWEKRSKIQRLPPPAGHSRALNGRQGYWRTISNDQSALEPSARLPVKAAWRCRPPRRLRLLGPPAVHSESATQTRGHRSSRRRGPLYPETDGTLL